MAPYDFWRHTNHRFYVGPCEPFRMGTVMGQIYCIVQENPGIEGGALLDHVRRRVKSGKSHYTHNGPAPAYWARDYVNGALKRNHLIVKP